MQKIVIAKPYRFVPARHGSFWPSLLALWLPRYLRKSYGIIDVTCRGIDRLRSSLDAGHGIMLAPNHCRPCDPMVIGRLAAAARCHLYIMASWHLFMQSRLQAWLLPRAGVFSVHREGLDREALKYAIRVLAEARRPLVIFPEGVISRTNDRLISFMEGTALIARGAARQLAAAGSPRRVVIHPVAIRYRLAGDLAAAAAPALERIEARLSWRPQIGLTLVDRVLKLGGAMLALKEIEYLGRPQEGEINERVQRLIDCLLRPLENEWLKGRREPDVVQRVKLLRFAILPDMVSGDIDAAEQERRWRQLADIYLAQQLSWYPAGYFTPSPTPERILETVERFEEDTTDRVLTSAPIRAVVDVGTALPVEPEQRRGGVEGDPLINELRHSIGDMLAASLVEAHPEARLV